MADSSLAQPVAVLSPLSPTARAFSPPSNGHNSIMSSNNDANKNNTKNAHVRASIIIPSQAISAQNNNTTRRNHQRKQRVRNGKGNRKKKATEQQHDVHDNQKSENSHAHAAQDKDGGGSLSIVNGNADKATATATVTNQPDNRTDTKKTRKKRNNTKQRIVAKTNDHSQAPARIKQEQPPSIATKKKKKKKKKRTFPWRQHIPPGTVDPISLDPLDALSYPPFALKITPPYEAIREWPIPLASTTTNTTSDHVEEPSLTSSNNLGNGRKRATVEEDPNAENKKEERQKKLLEEQWGMLNTLRISSNDSNAKSNISNCGSNSKPKASQGERGSEQGEEEEHYHLFDGRVLAYYLVSQLQFIDPLNRRDLTRDEIVQLDAYLVRHNLSRKNNNYGKQKQRGANLTNDIRVLEAYDARGVTASLAGVSGQSEIGRRDILQQEARVLLNAIFEANLVGNGSRDRSTRQNHSASAGGNELARQYAESQSSNRNRNNRVNDMDAHRNHLRNNENGLEGDDLGIYAHEGGGMLIIDDDFNPGLRGGGMNLTMQDYGSSLVTGLREQTDEGYHAARLNPHWTARNHFNDGHPIADSQVNDPSSAAVSTTAISDEDADPNPSTLWTSRNILTRHSHAARVQADNFPALSETTTTTGNNLSLATAVAKVSKTSSSSNNARVSSSTLSKIGNMVLKVSAKQLEKQRKAREIALYRAGLSINSGFSSGITSSTNNHSFGEFPPPMTGTSEMHKGSDPTEGQLTRNYEVASALGVKTSNIVPRRLNTGWSRPTIKNNTKEKTSSSTATDLDLARVVYPDTLIIKARELVPELLKLERKWTTFLQDDTAASCPLKSMDRPMRKFTHEYSDFWNLHTESFDPEPKRYVHCVKLDETSAPFPLLSQAVRTWRGPTRIGLGEASSNTTRSIDAISGESYVSDAAAQQTAGQATMSSAPPAPRGTLHLPEGRIPLKLTPRTVPHGVTAPPGAMFDIVVNPTVTECDDPTENASLTHHFQHEQQTAPQMLSINASKGPSLIPQKPAPRFAPLLAERDERTRLILDPRTKPLELPPFQPIKMTQLKESIEANRKAIEEKSTQQAEKKKSILATAFASDDEEDSVGSSSGSDEESDWDVGDAIYSGRSDEEE